MRPEMDQETRSSTDSQNRNSTNSTERFDRSKQNNKEINNKKLPRI